jgi:dipeptidase E
MRILLGSGGFRTEERIARLVGEMKSFFGDIPRLLFIPYALGDHDSYVQGIVERGLHAGYELRGLHRDDDPRGALEEAAGVFVGGGNTFRLLTEIYRLELLDVIRGRVRDGMPYLGVSAGTNIACPTIKTTNDMPIVMPPSLDALGLVPFQINPHYFEGQVYLKQGDGYEAHLGETRDDRIREFHEMNDTPVIGLWEGGILRIEDRQLTLVGTKARIFRKGKDPEDVAPGSRLDELLVR